VFKKNCERILNERELLEETYEKIYYYQALECLPEVNFLGISGGQYLMKKHDQIETPWGDMVITSIASKIRDTLKLQDESGGPSELIGCRKLRIRLEAISPDGN
jgi:hypothetical protein